MSDEVPDPSQLVVIDGNPAPEGIRSGIIVTRDGKRLRYAVCPSHASFTRGTVILLHGRNEAIEKYFETIGDLTRLGYMVATFDWRGQGGSQRLLRDSRRGHIHSFRGYMQDLDSFLHEVVLPDCRGPYAVLAHSMGGLVALLAGPRLVNRIERIVISAPLVSLPHGPGATRALSSLLTLLRVVGLGRFSVRPVAPQGQAWTLATSPLTSDKGRFERNRRLVEAAPQLFLGSPTVGWLSAALKAMRQLSNSEFIARLQVPTLIVTAGAERIVSTAESERLAWRMRSGHALNIPNARHELLQEADRYREPFLAAFDAFVGGALPVPDIDPSGDDEATLLEGGGLPEVNPQPAEPERTATASS
ncbi:alpha/beta fold hydrolase [Mangrovicella endophytica]|uniref:alpha/beta fold hydrolase n=1 Tax=Mangrovicella endophytica TaxID=2066697 RepID=UPI000C9E891F|nr:alpha/beta hydrolase [Mangrovicella endophytica]